MAVEPEALALIARAAEGSARDGLSILDQAIAIWLDAPIRVLADRVKRRDTRPLLRDRDAAEVLRELAAVRNPIYAQAPIRISSDQAPHDSAVNAILKAIGL